MEMKLHIMTIFILMTLLGCSTADKKLNFNEKNMKTISVSPKALNILSDLGYKDLKDKDNWNDVDVLHESDIETIKFMPPVIMSDGMTQIIKINHKEKKYWITVSGGISGAYQEKGPFEFK